MSYASFWQEWEVLDQLKSGLSFFSAQIKTDPD